VDAHDVEALGAGSDGTLVVADIGDNSAVRDEVEAYRIQQPGGGDHTVTPDTLRLHYSDGPRDAEALLYDDESGRVFVVSKELGDAHIYRTPRDAFDRGSATLWPVAAAPSFATDATYLPERGYAVIRGYGDASVFRTDGWRRVATFDLPLQQQGESIAAPADEEVVWVGTEGERSPVLAVDLPRLPSLTPSPPTSPGTPSASNPHGPEPGSAPAQSATSPTSRDSRELAFWIGGIAAVGLLIVLLTLLVRGRRSRHR
jgi:hypothetical protein